MDIINEKNTDKWIRPWEIASFDGLSIRDDRFFSIVVKGVLYWLTKNIVMYNKQIKHFIFNTGSSYMYVETNGYEYNWKETTGEDYMYMETPRCLCVLTEMSIQQEELTNPFVRGNYERLSSDGQIKGYNAEMRRLPVELQFNLQYVLSNFNETIILIQELFDKLVFQRYFTISYLGQSIICSIEFPSSQSLNQKKIDLSQADDKNRTLEISIKVNTVYPIINVDTEISNAKTIASFDFGTYIEDKKAVTDKHNHIVE